MNPTIQAAWAEYLRAHGEASRVLAKGEELYTKVSTRRIRGDGLNALAGKARAERIKLHAEGNKLIAEASILHADATLALLDVVLRELGNVPVEWSGAGIVVDGVLYLNQE